MGQFINNWLMNSRGLEQEAAGAWTSLTLILLSVLLTGFNIYPKLVTFGGAGALVPITGFANSVAAPAIEFHAEGEVFGVGCKIFYHCRPGDPLRGSCKLGVRSRVLDRRDDGNFLNGKIFSAGKRKM